MFFTYVIEKSNELSAGTVCVPAFGIRFPAGDVIFALASVNVAVALPDEPVAVAV